MLPTQRRSSGNFEHLSFNVGPTLLSWLEAHHPDVYGRIVDADRRRAAPSRRPTATPSSRSATSATSAPTCGGGSSTSSTGSAAAPTGMWLPETAVNDFVLRVLAEEGIRFTILAPGQIDADVSAPRQRRLPVARPRHDADRSAPSTSSSTTARSPTPSPSRRRRACASSTPSATAVVSWSPATDGETFGHHHDGADEIVALALAIAEPADGVRMPRLVDVLDESPPTTEVRVRDQRLVVRPRRRPLDDRLRLPHRRPRGLEPGVASARCATPSTCCADWGVEVFDRRGAELLRDPWAARDDYLAAADRRPYRGTSFAAEHVVGDGHHAGVLLDAQRNALLMYTSCGWFFNDLAGIETIQILKYAARSIDLYEQLGESPPVDDVPRRPGRGPVERPRGRHRPRPLVHPGPARV